MRRQKKHKWTKGIVKSSRLFSRFVFTLFFLKILWIRSKVHVGFWRDAKSNCRPTAKKKKKHFLTISSVCVCVFTESSIQQARAIRRIPPTLHIYKKNCLKMTARSTHLTLFSFLFLTATSSFFKNKNLSISILRYIWRRRSLFKFTFDKF
jgi:tRNA/tmRNA/rRNA uracil-C5-methylase (TrmA/RlmC/RlmD family)